MTAPFRGFASPRTAGGRSSVYGPVPWRMRGRAIAVWYRLQDPAEARRHVPAECEMDADPIVRARFWDMHHDAGLGVDAMGGNSVARPVEERWFRFREAVVAFPVRCAGVGGDFTTHMFCDDPVYIAFRREVMGWPLRAGVIDIDEASGVAPGVRLAAGLQLGGRGVMRCSIEVTRRLSREALPQRPPRWIGWKVIPDVDGRSMSVDQLVETGPVHIDWGSAWEASADLEFGAATRNHELSALAPRSISAAQYWADISLILAPGRVLVDYLHPPDGRASQR